MSYICKMMAVVQAFDCLGIYFCDHSAVTVAGGERIGIKVINRVIAGEQVEWKGHVLYRTYKTAGGR